MFKFWLCILPCLLLVTLADEQTQEDDGKIICDDGKVNDECCFTIKNNNYYYNSQSLTDVLYGRIFSIV